MRHLLRMRLCGSAKRVIDRHHAIRSLKSSAREQACCRTPGRMVESCAQFPTARKATRGLPGAGAWM